MKNMFLMFFWICLFKYFSCGSHGDSKFNYIGIWNFELSSIDDFNDNNCRIVVYGTLITGTTIHVDDEVNPEARENIVDFGEIIVVSAEERLYGEFMILRMLKLNTLTITILTMTAALCSLLATFGLSLVARW